MDMDMDMTCTIGIDMHDMYMQNGHRLLLYETIRNEISRAALLRETIRNEISPVFYFAEHAIFREIKSVSHHYLTEKNFMRTMETLNI